MKVLQFTIPVAQDRAVIVQEDVMPHFYPYLHRHREAQLIWIKEGEGTLLADNQMYPFKKNDIFLLGANQPHLFKSNPAYFEAESGLKIQALMIFFDPNGALAPLLDLPEMQLIKSFLHSTNGGLRVSPAQTDLVIQKMLTVQYAKNQELIIQFLQLLNVLTQLQESSEPLAVNSSATFSESEGIRIGHIFNFLMSHYDRNITLEEVADEAHMTPQAFCRYFKKHTRQTFVAFLNEMRVNEACKKLTSGNFENISTVAYTCGFNSLTNFNRVFKSVMGYAPKTYLESYFKNIKS
ncbi:AraC family transcriptional regulator [Pedobacter polaris]|uniref:AraC family transcriptional regulator n=1 Tax=Pedobacter polaris TaxID=2571273 RepID=A0A4U1CHZ8_9SPHI|nr:AraC family transcriptional regulator [Pedobacter polaris]TKC06477.1 AraC family transcriptional regulator [Pedobacter polaris]